MASSHMTVKVEVADLDEVLAMMKVLKDMVSDTRIDKDIRAEYQDRIDAILDSFKPHLVS